MTNETKKRLWASPWGYPESILAVLAVMLSGYALQVSLGCIDFHYLRWPVNGILGLILILIILILGIPYRKKRFVQWFSGVDFSVSLLGGLLLLVVFMGLTPQVEAANAVPHDIATILGLNRMTCSWPFVSLYVALLLSLGTLTARHLADFDKRKYAFYLNHLGLWLALFTTGLGAADLRRYVMYVQVKADNPEWRVYSEDNKVLELPVAIYLDDFILEQYDPKLAVIDRKTGESLPKALPEFVQLDSLQPEGKLLNWQIKVLKYIPDAVRTRTEEYGEVPMPGSAPAAKVQVTDPATGKSRTGWVSCGSFAQIYRKMDLDSTCSLVMTSPEPKRYASKVVVYSQYTDKPDTATIEVNKPLEHHGWMIYQYSYEEKMGKASPYSSFELVYDPWKKYVFLSFLLLAAGSVALFWKIKNRKDTES